MTNAYRAETPLRVGDKTLTLRIDYDAVGSFMTLFGDKDWTSGIMKAFDDYDMKSVCQVIQIAAKRHHPDLTVEQIHDLSPPFQVSFKALEASMFCFLYGHPNALENLDLDEPKAEDEEASGTRPLPSARARWRARGPSLLNAVSKLANFGR